MSSINADLAKSFERRTDKLKSSLGFGADWQDETSELYGDLVSRFAKQGTYFQFKLRVAIQVQVLARDFECWLKDYRSYLNSADLLVVALRKWIAFESNSEAVKISEIPSWESFFAHMDSVSNNAFPVLESTIRGKCIQPLEVSLRCLLICRGCMIHSKGLRR